MVPKGAENEAVAAGRSSRWPRKPASTSRSASIEFATSLKQAEAGEFQVFLINWSGRIDPDGNSYIFMRSKAPQNDGVYSNPEADKLLEEARLDIRRRGAQGDLREADQDPARRCADHLYLSPHAADRAHDEARGLQADARRARARGRAEVQVIAAAVADARASHAELPRPAACCRSCRHCSSCRC